MRPVIKPDRQNPDSTPKTYKNWGDAKPELIEHIGGYCSFCERPSYSAGLDVEHVQSKRLAQYKDLILRWDNFLLGCKNCNSTKGKKDVTKNSVFMPHWDNILCYITYGASGIVEVKKGLDDKTMTKTINFINLVGLDREPGHPKYSSKDDRYRQREKTFDLAIRYLSKFRSNKADTETIVDLASARGFFGIWLVVFTNEQVVIDKLISSFNGTCKDCFDKNGMPLVRL